MIDLCSCCIVNLDNYCLDQLSLQDNRYQHIVFGLECLEACRISVIMIDCSAFVTFYHDLLCTLIMLAETHLTFKKLK
jgi:hypothetical protein